MTVSVAYFISKSCTTCLFISKSFKELFFMTFVSKADAKVRTIFELPKLFRRKFQKVFFEAADPNSCSFVQYFNSSAFLSRKRVQKYCFTAYTPNHRNTFLQIFCKHSLKSLILKTCRRASFLHHTSNQKATTH